MADSARLDELRRQFEGNPRRYFAPLASALRRGGDAMAAVTLARAQLATYPGHLTGHVILGQALLDVGDPAGARDAFARAAALDEGNVVALQQLLTLARDAGDAEATRHWTARLVEADPELAAELSAPTPSAFEPLDLEDVAADADAGAFTAATLDPRLAVDTERSAFEAPAPLDPVVGLDVPPADPLPAPMRDALPDLIGADADEPASARFGESAAARGAQPPDDGWADDTIVAPPAAPFVTETMAALLLAQGHTAQAADVYERLLAQRPDDEGLRARLAALRGAPAGEPAEVPNEIAPAAGAAEAPDVVEADAEVPNAAEPPNASEVADAVAVPGAPAGEAPAAEAPAADGPDAADERAARMWRAAFAPLPPEAARDEVVRAEAAPAEAVSYMASEPPAAVAPADVAADAAAFDDLSFDHFFADAPESPDAAPAGDFERWAAEADRAGAAGFEPATAPVAVDAEPPAPALLTPPVPTPAATAPAPAASAAPDDPDEDLARFNAWLRGLAE